MKKLLLIIAGLLAFFQAPAQSMSDPATWSTKVEPGKGVYKLVFQVKLGAGWHIWSINPGGDGTLIGASFTFDKGKYTLVGKPAEMGAVTEEAMEGIDGKVRYFKDKVDFIQTVKAHKGDVVKGSYTYQLCNDKMCLPPKTASFSFRIP